MRNSHYIVRKMPLLIKKAGGRMLFSCGFEILLPKSYYLSLGSVWFAHTHRGLIKVCSSHWEEAFSGTRLGELVHQKLLHGEARQSFFDHPLFPWCSTLHLLPIKAQVVLDSKGKSPPRTDWQITQVLIHTKFLTLGTCSVGKKEVLKEVCNGWGFLKVVRNLDGQD